MSRCTRGALRLCFGVLVAACSSTPTVIPTKNLDRPTDIGFVCLGVKDGVADQAGQKVLSGQGMDVCHARGAADPNITPDGQRLLGTFAFIPNAGRGELAVADMDRGRLLDLTPLAPGYGMLPVGGDPESLSASQDGCWVVTANRTSCDLTLVDPSRLLAATFSTTAAPVVPATAPGDFSQHLAVHTGSGKTLQTSVGEIAFLPAAGYSPTAECQAGAQPRVVATFPSCDMVAILDLSFAAKTATIASAYYVQRDLPGGFQFAGNEPVCPADCAASAEETSAADGGAASPDGGISPGIDGGQRAYHLQPLALVPDGTRVYVGSLLDTAVTSFAIDAAGLGNPVRIELAENPGGISRLRLAIDPFRTAEVAQPDGSTRIVVGQFLRNRGTFLYAFASDDSIRVLNLDGQLPSECDVNIAATSAASCFPVGTPGRRPLAIGPGIQIPTFTYPDSPPPMPRDIAFADLQPAPGNANYHALSGQFGFVLASNGAVYVLNLAPNGEDGTGVIPAASCATHLPTDARYLPAVATHSFRELRDVGQCARTPIVVSIAPQRSVLQTDQAFATTATFSALDGPLIKGFSSDQGVTTTWLDYPDPANIISQKWDIVWEGVLPGTARSSGIVHGSANGQSAGSLTDAGGEFCASSVRPGDVLMFSGCTQNSDCQPDDRFSCQVSVSGARGMCLPIESATSTALIARCTRFMGSRMRYEIAQAKRDELVLQLKLDEVPKTTLNPCQTDADCRPDVDHGASLTGSAPDGGGRRAFECVEVRPQERRCVQRCSEPGSDTECRAGHVCEQVAWTSSGGPFCVEAPSIDAGCFPQPMTTYSVRAGHGFVVYGSSLPIPHTGQVAPSPDKSCRYDLGAEPSLINRIPLTAPRCPDTFLAQAHPAIDAPAPGQEPAAKFVQNLPAQAGANPCLYQGSHTDGDANGSVEAGAPGDHIRAFFQNPQIRFVLTNLEQYAGDLLAIHFELQHGFVPLTVQIPSSYEVMLTMGTRIVTGPSQTPESPIRKDVTVPLSFPYLYVVDQGRTALTPASRGQVLRINPRASSNERAAFDTTYSGGTPFQIQ
jgi:hypothetical protein